MQREKVRIYALARELNMESKDLLDLCRQAGIDVKNQLSSLEPEQRDAVEQLARRGSKGGVAVAPPPPKPVSVMPNLSKDVPVLPSGTTRSGRRANSVSGGANSYLCCGTNDTDHHPGRQDSGSSRGQALRTYFSQSCRGAGGPGSRASESTAGRGCQGAGSRRRQSS